MHRFTVVAHRRTGSNHLVSLLNSHPELVCYGEIFRNLYDVARFLPGLEDAFGAPEARTGRVGDFLTAIHGQVAPEKAGWGFKLMPFQVPNDVETILTGHVDRAIILRRDNHLAQFSSDLIAAETGQGVAGRRAEIKTAKVHFQAGAFEKFRAHVTENYDRARAALTQAGKPVLELEYMELQDADLPERLCAFLGVAPADLSSGHKKRNNPSVINRFKNYDMVRQYLMKKGLNDWAVESRSPETPRAGG